MKREACVSPWVLARASTSMRAMRRSMRRATASRSISGSESGRRGSAEERFHRPQHVRRGGRPAGRQT